ncbi:MAG: hypothetical protein L3J84_08725 [Gammaproteobacteria bacterium]|nr:hypothetical protein [Gammaproteobacteria bacterium]
MNKKYKLHLVFIAICLLMFMPYPAAAKPLYQTHVAQAKINDKTLQKSLKQVKKHKAITIIDNLSVPPFHKRVTLPETKKQSFCLVCHLPLPHRNDERRRTFMNMHSRYIACETCHFRPETTTMAYRWLAYDGIDAGNALSPRRAAKVTIDSNSPSARKHKAQFKKRVPLSPQPGARIAPFYKNIPVLLFKDTPFSQKIKKDWKDANENQRAEIKAKLHAPLNKEGPTCKKCHGKDETMLDLEILGASAAQLKKIQNNTIVRFFDRFKKTDERIRINKLLQ